MVVVVYMLLFFAIIFLSRFLLTKNKSNPFLILLLAASSFGVAYIFPDLDLTISRTVPSYANTLLGLTHRSWLTHSCLIVLIIGGLTQSMLNSYMARIAMLGAALGVALHLGSDLFPKSWTSFAFISFPVVKKATFLGTELATMISIGWLVLHIFCSFYLVYKKAQWSLASNARQ